MIVFATQRVSAKGLYLPLREYQPEDRICHSESISYISYLPLRAYLQLRQYQPMHRIWHLESISQWIVFATRKVSAIYRIYHSERICNPDSISQWIVSATQRVSAIASYLPLRVSSAKEAYLSLSISHIGSYLILREYQPKDRVCHSESISQRIVSATQRVSAK